ncbi:MAG TPA: hypothetical protein VD996_08965, partial [Chitinophagaceae bacterium]|nr:hypothetical protein [Chitinophagaceae bacterium]
MPSLNQLFQAINRLDTNNQFKTISYNITTNNTLNPTWWSFIPYGNWNNASNGTPPNPSPFEHAILDTLQTGFGNKNAKSFFIDLLHLGGGSNARFFSDLNAKITIVNAIAQAINTLPDNIPVTIRYLEGDSPGGADPNPTTNEVVKSFFPPNSPFRKKNVSFFFGGFNPDIQLSNNEAIKGVIRRFLDWIFSTLLREHPELHNLIHQFESLIIAGILKVITGNTIMPLTWNHGKIAAINGTNITTGGANFWNEYQTGSTGPFDMAMSINGSAAADGHYFANYLWQYLATKPVSDDASWCKVNTLGNAINNFKDTTQPAMFAPSINNTGNLTAVSASRNGHLPADELAYPLQAIDAVRDFIINCFAVIVEQRVSARIDFTAYLANLLSDDSPTMQSFFRSEGINTTAWASRYAKNYMVKNATSMLRISQQKLVLDDLLSQQSFKDFVAEFNRYTGCNWDGILWPYDLLMAIGQALSNISQSYQDGPRIQLVNSFYAQSALGYSDPLQASQFTAKLAGIMGGMQAMDMIKPKGDIDTLIKNQVAYKRVPQIGGEVGNHCKMMMVDDAACYIGSDNAYPSYNTEFGIWVEDA